MDNGACSYRRFLQGDESAFDEIMQEYFLNLVFFIDRYVHDLPTAEDIAMDVFTDLIVHRSRYNFKVSLKTYLFMLGRSRATDHLRRQKTVAFTEISEELLSDSEKALEEQVIFSEERRRIAGAIASLQGDMQEVIHLIYFEDMTYDEAARVLKKNKKQVDNLLYRAKKELRIILGKDGELLL